MPAGSFPHAQRHAVAALRAEAREEEAAVERRVVRREHRPLGDQAAAVGGRDLAPAA